MSICPQESVLLLHTEPRVVILHHAHNLFTCVAQVGFCWNSIKNDLTCQIALMAVVRPRQVHSFLLTCWLSVVLEHFTQHQLVGVFPERVPEHGYRDQEHVTVGTLRLIGAGAVKVPLRKI